MIVDEKKVKTHLIVTDISDDFHMNWCGKILGTNPLLDEKGIPSFVIIGSKNRMEVNTVDMNYLEKCAKRMTFPKGRSAITKDTAHIYIKEVDGNEVLLGVLTHRRIKSFAPMSDKVGIK